MEKKGIKNMLKECSAKRTVQHPDGMWVKTIPVSAGTGHYTLVSPPEYI